MNPAASHYESQTRLWLVAFGVSALVNLVVVSALSFWMLDKIGLRQIERPPQASSGETVAVIAPDMISTGTPAAVPAEAEPAPPPPAPARFARTSADQTEEAPEQRDHIGERSTRATSDAPAAPDAPAQPSQKGREPLWEDEAETTQSRYQDGDLPHDRIARTSPPDPAEPSPPAADHPPETREPEEITPAPPPPSEEPRERLAEGPSPIERRVSETKPGDEPKPASPERRPENKENETPDRDRTAGQPKPAANPNAPGFRGNQTKTRLVGSITRNGRSALNVEDSLLGRYHAAVSRAVEKEWQLNCVRNRDFITPGMLTMSFMLDASGKVREIRVVEALQVGTIPKGFTLNAINHAEIPSMPADLRRQLNGEPLELLYRFSF